MSNRYLLLLSILLLSGGCALGAGYQAATESWVGASIEEVITAWGTPDATEPLRQGERQYIWNEIIPDPIPNVHVDENGFTTYEYTSTLCQRIVTADPLGRVRNSWNSYDCWRSNELPVSRISADGE